MCHLNMFSVLLYTILITTTTIIVQCKYIYQPEMQGWVAQYKVIATWEEALRRCEAEGAVLMSPLREDLLDNMRSLIKSNTPHFIGTHSKFHPQLFVSIEGIPLEDMPLSDMYEQLDSKEGQCMSMTLDRIAVVPCSSRLPYMCYKGVTPELYKTECNTFDDGYKLVNATGHCYKFHPVLKTWSEAYFTCTAEGGYLAIIDDEEEAEMICNLIDDKSYYTFVGVRDWQGNGNWKTIHGKASNYIVVQDCKRDGYAGVRSAAASYLSELLSVG